MKNPTQFYLMKVRMLWHLAKHWWKAGHLYILSVYVKDHHLKADGTGFDIDQEHADEIYAYLKNYFMKMYEEDSPNEQR